MKRSLGISFLLLALAAPATLTGCAGDADTAADNLQMETGVLRSYINRGADKPRTWAIVTTLREDPIPADVSRVRRRARDYSGHSVRAWGKYQDAGYRGRVFAIERLERQ